MAIFTVCVTQENIDYKLIHEANALNLGSVPTFHLSSLVEYSLVKNIVLVLEKGIFLSTIFRCFVVKTCLFPSGR